jgi:hypothetical protein
MADSKGGAGSKKFGRNKNKCTAYRAHQQREKNKIKKVLQSNGYEYAKAWAAKNSAMAFLNRLVINVNQNTTS